MNPASLILLRIFRVRSWLKLLFSFHTWEHKLGAWGTPDTQSANVKMKIRSQICAARFCPPGLSVQVGLRWLGSAHLTGQALLIWFPFESSAPAGHILHQLPAQYTSGGWKLEEKPGWTGFLASGYSVQLTL